MNLKSGFFRLSILFSIFAGVGTFILVSSNNYWKHTIYSVGHEPTGRKVSFEWKSHLEPDDADFRTIFEDCVGKDYFAKEIESRILSDENIFSDLPPQKFLFHEGSFKILKQINVCRYSNFEITLFTMAGLFSVWALWPLYYIIRGLIVFVMRGFAAKEFP